MIFLWLAFAVLFLLVVRPKELGRIGGHLAASALLTIYAVSQALLPGMNNPDSYGIWWLVAAGIGQLVVELLTWASGDFSPWRHRVETLQTLVIAIALVKVPIPTYAWLPLLVVFILILPVGYVAVRKSGANDTITGLFLLWTAAFPLIDRNWLPGNGWAASAGAFGLAALRLSDEEHAGTTTSSLRHAFQLAALGIILAGAVPHFLQFR